MQTPPSFTSQNAPMPPPPHRVRFDAIGEAWRWYMADMGNWILGVLLVLVISVAPIFIIQMIVTSMLVPGGGMFAGSGGQFGSPAVAAGARMASLVSTLVAIPFGVCTQLLTAGLQRRAMLQVRGFRADVGEIFKLDGMGLQVMAYGFVYVLISLPFQLYSVFVNDPAKPLALFEPARLLGFCGLGLLVMVVQILIAFAPLVIVDQHVGVGPAIKKSFETFGRQLFPLLGVFICAGLLAASGALACGIGVLFTMPVIYTLFGVIYNDFFRPMPVGDVENAAGWYPRQV